MNLNKLFLAGRLTRDPETRYLQNGNAVCEFSVAVNRSWKSDSGEKKDEVTFLDVTFFGKTAETITQYLKKGNPIYIEGRLKLNEWDDKKTNEKRRKVVVIGESFQFIGAKSDTEPPRQQSTPSAQPAKEDQDVPF